MENHQRFNEGFDSSHLHHCSPASFQFQHRVNSRQLSQRGYSPGWTSSCCSPGERFETLWCFILKVKQKYLLSLWFKRLHFCQFTSEKEVYISFSNRAWGCDQDWLDETKLCKKMNLNPNTECFSYLKETMLWVQLSAIHNVLTLVLKKQWFSHCHTYNSARIHTHALAQTHSHTHTLALHQVIYHSSLHPRSSSILCSLGFFLVNKIFAPFFFLVAFVIVNWKWQPWRRERGGGREREKTTFSSHCF